MRRRLVAAFVTWHLFAIAVGALPPATRFNNFPKRDPSAAPSAVVHSGTVVLDGFAWVVGQAVKGLTRLVRPVRPAVGWYLRLTGLGQSWAMFSNPPRVDQYARVRYYVQPANGREWTATELVMPANHEDETRLFQSYRDSYRDKAVAIALDTFYQRRRKELIKPDTQPGELPNDLAPIARYFARHFERRALSGTGERIVRTEVWIGSAPTPGLGQPIDYGALAQRKAALQAYWEGAVEQRLRVPPRPPYHALEQEADISWVLEYYELP
jgi:hypothetical protein